MNKNPSTSEPSCTDIYGYNFPCDIDVGDPCVITMNPDTATRLYSLIDCQTGDETLDHWCGQFPEHPVCAVPALPPTGTETAAIAVGAGAFLLAGVLLLAAMNQRTRRTGEHNSLLDRFDLWNGRILDFYERHLVTRFVARTFNAIADATRRIIYGPPPR